MIRQIYEVTITDTFGDDVNWSWVRKHYVYANSPRGAMKIASGRYGAKGWRLVYDSFDETRYDLKGAPVCAFVTHVTQIKLTEREEA